MNYDIVIIGCGVSGMTAAIYALRSDKSVLILEKESIGGAIASSPKIENYPGYQKISGAELADNLYEQVISLGGVIELEEVTEIKVGNEKEVITTDNIYTCKAIIIATGSKYRLLGLPNETDLIGNGVHFCVSCDGAFYKDKTVTVLGGGDTALDDALYLSDICKKVYLIHRRNEFRGAQSTVEKLKEKDNVEFVLSDSVVEIKGDKKLDSVKLASGKELAVDGIFIAYGSVPQTALVKDIVQLDDKGYIVAGEDGFTNSADNGDCLMGFFAAGDVRTKKLRQVVTAVSDGANAATSAAEYLMKKCNDEK